jgi:hypothetical protein
MMRDDEITNLQSSIAWFKKEAVKLNEILDQQKGEIQRKKFLEKHYTNDQKRMEEYCKDLLR